MIRPSRPGSLSLAAAIVSAALLAGCSTYGTATLPHFSPKTVKGLTVSPKAVSMGPGDVVTLSASESGYAGTYGSTDNCSGIVTVVALGSSQFTVTGVAPGLCTITVSDTNGNSMQVGVSIQTTVIGGQ